MRKRNFSQPAVSRLDQVKRLLTIASLFAGGRLRQMNIITVAEKLTERTGRRWCERTIRRDLIGLIEIGLIEKTSGRGGTNPQYSWSGDSDFSRLTIQSLRTVVPKPKEAPESLSVFLATLPDPWELDDDQRAIATSAARLVAVMQTGDRRYMKAELAFTVGAGWFLPINAELNAFDQSRSLPDAAAKLERETENLLTA